ncbi:MAG: hypothetical protein HY454_03470 [Parcubacteria group bacterium]|nr:hypothetical protein [Parcubacteria group bacterium]
MPRIKEIILALAIVVVLNLFFNYGVFTFYKPPQYEVFCPVELTQKQYPDEASCKAVGGQWFESGGDVKYYRGEVAPVPAAPDGSDSQKGWCDPATKCRENHEAARNVYNRNVFVVLVVAGLAALALGFLVFNVPAVSHGFLGGGLVSLIIGTIRYWSDMDDYLRFVILGIALVVLVWLGYRKLASR